MKLTIFEHFLETQFQGRVVDATSPDYRIDKNNDGWIDDNSFDTFCQAATG